VLIEEALPRQHQGAREMFGVGGFGAMAGHVEFIGLVHILVIWSFIGGFHLPIQ
jgi:hypothetical protein